MKKPQNVYIGIDVGGTKILGGLVTSSGKVLSRRKVSTPPKAKPDRIGRIITALVRDLSKESSAAVKGIGIGIPGMVAPNFRDIFHTPNIRLSRYPLHRRLVKKFRVPVVLGNDVNCGLMGEKWLGAARRARNVIGIFPGTGVGGAIIIDGNIYTGSQGAAAELGHMIIDYNSPVVHAGVPGSLEGLTSRQAIERRIREAVRRKEKTVVTKITKGDLTVIKSKVIAKALKRHDRVVVDVLNDVCSLFGKACISLRHVFNPDVIVFGGGLIEACRDYMIPRIRLISACDPLFRKIDRCRIVASKLGDDAVLLGAVRLVMEREAGR